MSERDENTPDEPGTPESEETAEDQVQDGEAEVIDAEAEGVDAQAVEPQRQHALENCRKSCAQPQS